MRATIPLHRERRCHDSARDHLVGGRSHRRRHARGAEPERISHHPEEAGTGLSEGLHDRCRASIADHRSIHGSRAVAIRTSKVVSARRALPITNGWKITRPTAGTTPEKDRSPDQSMNRARSSNTLRSVGSSSGQLQQECDAGH
jgi:hypothetical protein